MDNEAPSVREGQPATRYHNVWVFGEKNGKPVLKDVRYHVKYVTCTRDGSALAA